MNHYSHPIAPPGFNFHDSAELTIIIAIYNKVHYLNRSLSSILNLPISRHLIRILCIDDDSTDGSIIVLKKFQRLDPRVIVHRNPRNLGTHITRISGVLRVTTPYLTFLDPDDLFVGTGLEAALTRIRSGNLDIVEFECRVAFPPSNFTNIKCWRTPRTHRAPAITFRHMFYTGRVNCHLHRKIFRTSVYRRAIENMPPFVRNRRLVRYEDKLQFAFIVEAMEGEFEFLPIIGEYRFQDLDDNSQSFSNLTENNEFVDWAINKLFQKSAY